MLVPYWKTLIRIVNGPCVLFTVVFFFINESPRWQLVTGRLTQAKRIMKRIARDNKINIDFEELATIDDDDLKEKFDINSKEVKESFINAMKSKEITIRLLVSSMGRFTTNFVYYGMMINSVWLPGDKYVNFLLSTLMSFPGEIISLYLMNKIGRKIPLLIGYVICGILCIISALIPAREYYYFCFLVISSLLDLIKKTVLAGFFAN